MNEKPNQSNDITRLKRQLVVLLAVWIVLISGSLAWNIYQEFQQINALAEKEALATHNKDQAFRLWATSHGGVYVPVSDRTPPNPYLKHIPERDIQTKSGKKLTLMNPAYVLRQVIEDFSKLYNIKGKITSLNPLNPDNKPDAWEARGLKAFERGRKKVTEFSMIDGELHLRFMKPMFTSQGCLKCHAHQGYKVGDIRGAVSVAVPMAPFYAVRQKSIIWMTIPHVLLFVLGLIAIGLVHKGRMKRLFEKEAHQNELIKYQDHLEELVDQRTKKLSDTNQHLIDEITMREKIEAEREILINDLQTALAEVKTLQGIFPICSSCKKIRDDEGYWQVLEKYIQDRSDALFSHSLCPDCVEKLYPELAEELAEPDDK